MLSVLCFVHFYSVLHVWECSDDDLAGSSDPLCEVYVGKERKFITEVKKKTLEPVWNETVTLELPQDDKTLKLVSFLLLR